MAGFQIGIGETLVAIAFLAEFLLAFILMTLVLNISNREKLAHLTGIFSGILVAIFIAFEAPISGMSIIPRDR